jgi:putative transposase
MRLHLRRSPRLNDFDYIGPLVCFLTFVTRRRSPILLQADLAQTCLDCLERSSQKHGVKVRAYCLMPDHVHLLVEVPEGVSLGAFVQHFKQLSSYALKQRTGSEAWQISYYDHILRNEESMLDVARYIWDNPVRKGLVNQRGEYTFSGPRQFLES